MKITTQEIGVIIAALNTKSDGSARTFQAIQLPDVASMMTKLKVLFDKDGKLADGEHEIKLSTDEKKLAMDCIDDREWVSGDAEFVLSVKEKLK